MGIKTWIQEIWQSLQCVREYRPETIPEERENYSFGQSEGSGTILCYGKTDVKQVKLNRNMTKKKSFALRIDNYIMSAVEKWAADEFRSTNGQLEWIIYKALKDAKRLKKNITLPEEDYRENQ